MSGAEFMGGPLDGQLRDFPGEPPRFVQVPIVDHNPAWSDSIAVDAEGNVTQMRPESPYVGFHHFRYRREVSTLDDGALWVFVPDTPSG